MIIGVSILHQLWCSLAMKLVKKQEKRVKSEMEKLLRVERYFFMKNLDFHVPDQM
jgi:hypothetical protein